MFARCYLLYRCLIAALAALLFFVCLSLHISTFCGIDPYESIGYELQYLILGPIFLGIVPMAFAVGRHGLATDFQRFYRELPWWLFGLVVALFVYTVFLGPVISWQLGKIEGRVWRLEDGTYGLFDRSEFLRPSSVEEFHRNQANEVQHMSRFGMFAFGLGFAWVNCGDAA